MSKRWFPVCLIALLLISGGAVAGENPYLAGEFKVTRVVDGDTIGVEGLDQTIRFVCLDTEECEKGNGAEERTRAIAADYANYLREKTARDPMAKFSTPVGWMAKEFAETWFPIGSTVRIEYDSLARKTGYYGRVLGYVFALRDGKWVNYNIECVRAGMSPYFDKYGASLRFEREFLAAEREARAHGRGLWAPAAMAYPNYDARIAWWSRRAEQMKRFDRAHAAEVNAINLIDEDDWDRLKDLLGKDIRVLATADDLIGGGSPALIELQHKQNVRFAVSFMDTGVFAEVRDRVNSHPGDFFVFQGVLEKGFERGDRTYVYNLPVTSADRVAPAEPVGISVRIAAESPEAASSEPAALPLGPGDVSWQEAPGRMNEAIAVVGKIIRTNDIGNLTFLNFDSNFRETLTLVVRKADYEKFSQPPEIYYRDKMVRAKGTVTQYQGKPQIMISGPEQIEVLE